MTVVLVPVVMRFGADAVFVVGILAGILIVTAAVTGLGRYLAFIPWPVVEGFTVGIATIIFLQQVPAALGVMNPPRGNTAAVALRVVGSSFKNGNAAAAILLAVVVVVMVVANRIRHTLPSSLIAVAAATIVAKLAHFDVARIGTLPHSLPIPTIPSFHGASSLLGPALAVAALAALESLLSAKVADGLADLPRHDPDRELFGQGLANLVSPLFGGMPATGAIARTAVNVRAGARTRAAAMFHSLVLVLVVLFAGGLVSQIPLAALAGVLMVTAVHMIEPLNVRAVVRATRSDAIVLVLTAITTIAFDLIFAVEVGIVSASLLALRNIARTSSASIESFDTPPEVDGETEAALLHEHIVTYRIDGALFFGAAQRFLTELSAVSDVKVVILRLPQMQMLDATGAHALGEIVTNLERRKITVLLKGPRAAHIRVMGAVGVFDRLASEAHTFSALDDAVRHARLHVSRTLHPPASLVDVLSGADVMDSAAMREDTSLGRVR